MRTRLARSVALAVGLCLALYGGLVRRWMLDRGSTTEERVQSFPGDEMMPEASYMTTRAVTIKAPAGEVWPWLVQMGQDRAGFYTHNWVERLLGAAIPDVAEIHPEWQHLEPGDLMRTYPERVPGKPIGWPVIDVEPGQSVVLQSRSMPTGTYAFLLAPRDDGTTRLLVRNRAHWKWWEWPFAIFVFEPLHAYMETGVLLGIKQRAERYSRNCG